MGIFRLRCVCGIRKDREYVFAYILRPFEIGMDTYFVIDHDYNRTANAHPGQWLCEMNCGDWVVLDDEDYRKTKEES